jgi:hypothetical protein
VEAVGQLDRLDRHMIRHVFERRFSATTMARKFLDIYSTSAGVRGSPHPAIAARA